MRPQRTRDLSAADKARNKAQEVKGNVKEGVGRATDNRSLQAKGHTDQAKAKAKGIGERIKDLFR